MSTPNKNKYNKKNYSGSGSGGGGNNIKINKFSVVKEDLIKKF